MSGAYKSFAEFQKRDGGLMSQGANKPSALVENEGKKPDSPAAEPPPPAEGGNVQSADVTEEVVEVAAESNDADESPKKPMALEAMADLQRRAGKMIISARLYRQVLAVKSTELGRSHLGTVDVMENLAMVLFKSGDLDEAEELCREALKYKQVHCGAESPMIVLPVLTLASICAAKGANDYASPFSEEAERLYKRILVMRSAIDKRGSTNSTQADLGIACHKMGHFYKKCNRMSDASRMLRRATKIRRVLKEAGALVSPSPATPKQDILASSSFAEPQDDDVEFMKHRTSSLLWDLGKTPRGVVSTGSEADWDSDYYGSPVDGHGDTDDDK